MQVQILSVTISTQPAKTGKTYQVADVAYKNLSFQGKIEGKKCMSFGAAADSFKVLATAQPGDVYDVEVVKNQAGYNDWVKMTKAEVNAGQPAPTVQKAVGNTGASSTRSTYETPEERAARQVLIVRQSSVSSAVATLSVGAKTVKPDDVLALAQKYTDFVFGKGGTATPQGGATGFDDVPDFDPEFKPE